jgi:hypothetical protein
MTYLVLIIILLEYHNETTQDVGKIEQTIVLENRVEDAQKKCLWSADARRYPPVKEVQNALLPSSNCLEIQAP